MEVRAIRQEVEDLIAFGKTKKEITSSLVRSKIDSDPDQIAKAVEIICNEYPNYSVIQKVMRSDIVLDQNDDSSLLHVIDIEDKEISKMSSKALKSMFAPKFKFKRRVYNCNFEYRPLDTKILIKEKSNWIFNTFKPPFWMKDYFYSEGSIKLKKETDYPKVYKDFFNHLFDGDEKSWDYTLDWLANAVQDRNYCILTTIGRQGIGKGVFGGIMERIFGAENFYGGRDEMFKGRFNSQLLNKRLVYVDEIKIDNANMEDRVKAVVNDSLEIESKGKDAQYVRNYANVYISSNRLDSLRLQADDRRFSIVDLTNTQLIDPNSKFNTDRIHELYDESNISAFSRYLYYREVDKSKMLKVFKSKRTEEVRNSSLKIWEEWLLDEYGFDNKGKVVPLREVTEAVHDEHGFKPGRSRYQDLELRFPSKVKVRNKKNDKGKQIWTVEFL